MRRFAQIALFTIATAGLSACTTSGLDARSSFKCTEENGFQGCNSISNTFNYSTGRRTDDQLQANQYQRNTPYSGMPVRAPISVLRVWVAPWEDKKGVLHDQSYMYFPLNESRWLIDHNRENIVDEYRPTVRLLGSGDANTVKKASNEELPDLGLKPTEQPLSNSSPLSAPPSLIPPPVRK